MKSVVVAGIWGAVVLIVGACGPVLDVDGEEYRTGCQTGQLECIGNTPKTCLDGVWSELSPCVGQTCLDGQCRGECEAGKKECVGNAPATCDENGNLVVGGDCWGLTTLCFEGACVTPSCAGLPDNCGPYGDETCCAVTGVQGGSYYRSNDSAYPATVNNFTLDRFEITVGRFRKFVDEYPENMPVAGSGMHPAISGSGWNPSWNSYLPISRGELILQLKCGAPYETWTDSVGGHENRPINCITWYEAFAFCIFDGGRLPTEAEWNYAAAGGNEQREYPWSQPSISYAHAVYDGLPIADVGSRAPTGNGKWAQADLAGNVMEWVLDMYASPYVSSSCNNCANFSGSSRVLRGGSWLNSNTSDLSTWKRIGVFPFDRYDNVGARCARSL